MLKTVAQRLLCSSGLQRCIASTCRMLPTLLTSPETCGSQNTYYQYSTDVSGPAQKKLHVLKCTKAVPTPVSQAVAFMISKDQIPHEQLLNNMDTISEQLLQSIGSYSSTELSAFAEACRQIGYVNQQAFTQVIQHLAPAAASIPADELPSLLWAAASLTAHTAASAPSSSSSNDSSSNDSSSSSGSSEVGRTVPVPRHDGVSGSVNSVKVLGVPGLVEFLLGASQVLTADIDDITTEELPVLAAALAELEYRDPFLLTTVAEAAMDRKSELSESELLSLINTFASMGRWFFDNRLLDQLTVEVVARATDGLIDGTVVEQVAAALEGINHKNKVLQQHLRDIQR